MIKIPFTLPDMNLGLTEIKGRVYIEEDFLVLEVEKSFLGEFNADYHIIRVELGALKDVRLERGWFLDKLWIWPKKRDLLEALPGTFTSEVPLKIWRKYRHDTEKLISHVQDQQRRYSTK